MAQYNPPYNVTYTYSDSSQAPPQSRWKPGEQPFTQAQFNRNDISIHGYTTDFTTSDFVMTGDFDMYVPDVMPCIRCGVSLCNDITLISSSFLSCPCPDMMYLGIVVAPTPRTELLFKKGWPCLLPPVVENHALLGVSGYSWSKTVSSLVQNWPVNIVTTTV